MAFPRGCLCLLAAVVICHGQSHEWISLFDGKTLKGWHVLGGASTFEVRDATIYGTSVPRTEHTFLCTERTFGDFILEYDFLVDPDLNSGVQIRSHSDPAYQNGKVYGLQVEIDGDTRTMRMWSGGIFDQTRRGWLNDLSQNEPARKAFRPGEWNHARVEAIGDSIKTWINAVPAADLVDSMDLEGFLGLQVHSNRLDQPQHVAFRNLRIQDLGKSRLLPVVQQKNFPAGTGSFKTAFNHLYSSDYTARLQYRVTKGTINFDLVGTSRLRIPLGVSGPGDLTDGGARVIARPEPQKGVKPFPLDGWNQVTVSYHSGRLVVHANGVRVVDTRDFHPGKPTPLKAETAGSPDSQFEIHSLDLLVSKEH